MAEGQDETRQEPSLELPKLRLRRRRSRPEPPEPPGPPRPAEQEPTAPKTPPPAPELEERPPLFVDEVEPRTEPLAPQGAGPAAGPTQDSREDSREDSPDDSPEEPAEEPAAARRSLTLRRPGGMPAAVLTGVVVGLGIVGLTWAGLRVCEAAQGTSSCGGAGYPVLTAIMVLMVVVGGLLLRVAGVRDPGATSFLAVGLTAVVALLFLIDSLLDRAMVVVIPVICAAMFAVAHWVTRTFTEPARD